MNQIELQLLHYKRLLLSICKINSISKQSKRSFELIYREIYFLSKFIGWPSLWRKNSRFSDSICSNLNVLKFSTLNLAAQWFLSSVCVVRIERRHHFLTQVAQILTRMNLYYNHGSFQPYPNFVPQNLSH